LNLGKDIVSLGSPLKVVHIRIAACNRQLGFSRSEIYESFKLKYL